MRSCGLLLALLAALSCARAPAKAPAEDDAPRTDRRATRAAVPEKEAPRPEPVPAEPARQEPQLVVERWRVHESEDDVGAFAENAASPAIELLFPFAGQVIKMQRAESYPVRIKLKRAAKHHEVELSLDGRRPRSVIPGKARKLGELVAANETLEPGLHVLTATLKRPVSAPPASGGMALIRASGPSSDAPFAVVQFWVGERGDGALDSRAPILLCGAPFGTFNGPRAADAVPLDFMVVGAELGEGRHRFELTVNGPRSVRATLLDDAPRVLRDLPSGDYRIKVELTDAAGQKAPGLGSACDQTITVNRQGPEGNEP